jgi:hypothetical protein
MKLKQIPLIIASILIPITSSYPIQGVYTHPSLEERKEIRLESSKKVIPNHSIDEQIKDLSSVNLMLDMLENVPDSTQYFCNKHGGIIYFVEGELTLHQEAKHLRKGRSSLEGIGLRYVSGFVYKEKAFLKNNYENTWMLSKNLPLHEYGHLVDNILEKNA